MEFCVRLKELREERELTQEAVARALGVSRQSVIQLEHGRFMPSFEVAQSVARFFDLSFDELLGLPRPIGYHTYQEFVTAEIDLPEAAARDRIQAKIQGDRLVVTIPLTDRRRPVHL